MTLNNFPTSPPASDGDAADYLTGLVASVTDPPAAGMISFAGPTWTGTGGAVLGAGDVFVEDEIHIADITFTAPVGFTFASFTAAGGISNLAALATVATISEQPTPGATLVLRLEFAPTAP
jgi:hypothetical protein